MLNRDTYIEERLNDQINWYSKKSRNAKKAYISTSIIILTLTSFISVLTILIDGNEVVFKIIIASFGAISAILTGLLSIVKWKECWINYRYISEKLKKEKISYLTQSGNYNECDGLGKLITECEEIMKLENEDWIKTNNKK